jgi:hypothetical protein
VVSSAGPRAPSVGISEVEAALWWRAVGAARWLVVGGGGGDAVEGSRERFSYA